MKNTPQRGPSPCGNSASCRLAFTTQVLWTASNNSEENFFSRTRNHNCTQWVLPINGMEVSLSMKEKQSWNTKSLNVHQTIGLFIGDRIFFKTSSTFSFFPSSSSWPKSEVWDQIILSINTFPSHQGFKWINKQGNYSLRRPPKLTIPQAVIGQRWATVNSNLYKQTWMYICMTHIPALTPS